MSDNLPPLRDVIRRHGLRARKSLGQNFLLDANLNRRIVRAAEPLDGVNVFEVGPGPGGLTREILALAPASLTVVEKDHRAIAALEELAAAGIGRLTIIEGDAATLDPTAMIPAPRKIIANLPYNISTHLLIVWLENIQAFSSLTLMFQREVADRILAQPGSKAYGRLSVMTQWRAEVRLALTVDRQAFTPPPKVDASVLLIRPRTELLADVSWRSMEAVTRAAFGQRRKMLKSALKGLAVDWRAAGIDPSRRAEDLTVAEFGQLAKTLEF